MGTTTIEHWSRNRRSQLWTLAAINGLVAVQILAAVFYALAFGSSIVALHIFLIPFVWTTVSIVAVWYAKSVDRGLRPKLLAGSIASGYFLLFLGLSGTIGLSPDVFEPITGAYGLGVEVGRSLGWGPVLYYSGEWIGIRIIPYQLIGYLALSYLVYVAILDVTQSASAGTIGLILCPGCAAAFFAPVFAGIAGVSSALSVLIRFNYELATILFVAAIGFLHWQPSLDELRRTATTNLYEITTALAILAGALHLLHPQHGVFRLIQFLQVGVIDDPRPVAFTLAGIAIFVGIGLAYADIARESMYLFGIGLMIVFIGGYAAWHTVLDHGAFWPYIEAHGHSDQWFVETIAVHLVHDGYALLSKSVELLLLVLLVVCYRRE